MKRMVNNAEKANNLIRTSFVLPESVLADDETLQYASKTKKGQILINFCNTVAESVVKLGELDADINNLEKVKNYPLGIVTTESSCYMINASFDALSDIQLISLSSNTIYSKVITYDREQDTITIQSEYVTFISEDYAHTIFGQTISGTGNIELYRHQMTITNADDVSVIYIVDSANDLVVNSAKNFVAVTKANTNYTGLASYLGADGDIHPAFIRYTAGNVVIQLQNGSISQMKSVTDIVTPISL